MTWTGIVLHLVMRGGAFQHGLFHVLFVRPLTQTKDTTRGHGMKRASKFISTGKIFLLGIHYEFFFLIRPA